MANRRLVSVAAVATSATAYTGRADGLFSTNDQAKLKQAGLWPLALSAPSAPTIGTATAGILEMSVAFTAPSSLNGSTITGYTVTSSPGGQTASGASSPLVITGLTFGTSYTFTVVANSNCGSSLASSTVSGSPLEPAPGQQAYTTVGTYTWVAPAGVTSVSVVAIGGGGSGGIKNGTGPVWGGGGGGLGYTNNITVVPGQSYTVVVGGGGSAPSSASPSPSAGGDSYFISTGTVVGYGGTSAAAGGAFNGHGGGSGGTGGRYGYGGGGGGGAGGYTGNGGNGGGNGGAFGTDSGYGFQSYGGGGGGGGAGGSGSISSSGIYWWGGWGGGTGILGTIVNADGWNPGRGGNGGYGTGSYGQYGNNGSVPDSSVTYVPYAADAFGNGGPGPALLDYTTIWSAMGGKQGAVRIIWGSNRSFPSTNTGNR